MLKFIKNTLNLANGHLREPAGIKNTRLHDIDSAFETWNELINGVWIEVKSQFQGST